MVLVLCNSERTSSSDEESSVSNRQFAVTVISVVVTFGYDGVIYAPVTRCSVEVVILVGSSSELLDDTTEIEKMKFIKNRPIMRRCMIED